VTSIGEHGVENHHPLNHAAQRRGPPIAIVRLPNRLVERLVLEVDEPSSVQRAGGDHCHVPAVDELPQKVMRLLAVGDAGERAVLPLQKDPCIDHDMHEEPRLALREAEASDGLDEPDQPFIPQVVSAPSHSG